MIGCLIGEVLALEAPTVLLNVNGVGYEIDTPLTTFCQLQKGQQVTLWTHLAVREDAQLLYGFINAQEKTIFRTLLKVNGVGPKMALGILSTLSVEMLIHTVENEDVNTLVKVPGVGKKTAERLLVELKDRFKNWESTPLAGQSSAEPTGASTVTDAHSAEKDAVSALISLGFKPAQASHAVSSVFEEGLSSEDLIRRALKGMA